MVMDTQEIRLQLNGFGKRLTEIEKLDTKVVRNASDIQKVFEELAEIPERNRQLVKDIGEKQDNLLKTVLVSVVVSIGMATWAIVTK